MRRYMLCLLGLALLASRALGAAHPSTFRVPLMKAPPKMDGRIDPSEWACAVRIDGLTGANGILERRRSCAYVGATVDHLYVAIRSELPAEGSLLAEVRRDAENLVFDDAVEVWIDPTPGAERGTRFQMLANSLGHRWFRAHAYGGAPENPAWHGDWQAASALRTGAVKAWECEIAIPIASLAPGRRADEGSWAINVCRDWKQEWAWSSLNGSEYKPADLFIFSKRGVPAVSSEILGDPFLGNVDARITLANPGTQKVTANVDLLLARDLMPEMRQHQSVSLAPGSPNGGSTVRLAVQDQTTRRFTLTATVSTTNGQRIFERTWTWTASRRPWRWTVARKVIPPLDFQFAYYPYQNRMRILADASHLPKGAAVTRLTAWVRKKGGSVVHRVQFGPLHNGRREESFTLKPLNGVYEIVLRAEGHGISKTEVVKTFERTVFPWEHNRLGTSAKVYPPFVPIRVRNNRVRVVLREIVMADTGLWEQVTSKGRPLLSEPMRWEVRAGSSTIPVHARRMRFTKVTGNAAVAVSQFTAGAFAARIRCGWDYDGLMRADLTLLPSHGKAVEGLDLVVPLRDDEATHYHAMGDGIRNTLYGRVPLGAGTVWTAKQVQCSDLPANFCSYLYVGTPLRGLCWFAENDRNWGWDPSTPNAELIRRPGVVEMRIHLINRPEVITRGRTITFGLMAAPVKPRITADWRHKFRRDNYQLLGTDINWLALGDCGSVYPAGCDMELWRMIARGNCEHLTEADIQKVIERGKRYFEPYGSDRVQTFINHVRYNLTSHYGAKMIFYYNRASYQAAPEFETFKDEWSLTNFRTVPKGNGISEIKIVPSRSYIDHALYWYGKSFDIARNRGVYWDNWFFVGSYNPFAGAYRRKDGQMIPTTGVWGLRELAKRTFQYMNERRMLPITMAHMTSTGILPILSFATVQYDWEWKYSEGDVQTRFPRDYILLVSNGELAGTWPVVLNDHGPQADDPWTARTFAAVAMVHELDCPYPSWSAAGRAQLALFKPVDEILATPGVRAYRYWDDTPPPVRSQDPDFPTIVYSVKGKEAVFAVVSYSDAAKDVDLFIDAAALGFPGGCRVVNTETSAPVPVVNRRITIHLKKHDLCICRILANGAASP
ncbi:MAG: glycoside hydrolase domain-containing protein [Chthonomonadales bacterium]